MSPVRRYVRRNAPLHIAALNKRATMVLFLIAELADVTKANKAGCVTRTAAQRAPSNACAFSCAICWCAVRRPLPSLSLEATSRRRLRSCLPSL